MNRNKILLNKIYKLAQDLSKTDYKALENFEDRKEYIKKFLIDLIKKISGSEPALSERLSQINNRLYSASSAGYQAEKFKELKNLENVLNNYCQSCKDTVEYKNLKAQVDNLFFSPEEEKFPVPTPSPTPNPEPKKLSPEQYTSNLMGAVNTKVNKYKNQYGTKDNPYIGDETKTEFNDLDKNIIKELNRIYNTTNDQNVKTNIENTFKNLINNVSSEITAAMPNLHFSPVNVSATNYIKSNEPEELSWEDFTGSNTLQVGKTK